MKTLNFKFSSLSFIALLMLGFFITSCDKNETIQESLDVQEGYLSTSNNTEPLDIDISTAEKPALHMHFSKDLSEEEADAQWDKAVKEYIKTLPQPDPELEDRAVSTEWFSSVRTRTGSQSYNGTDGDVYVRLNFRSNLGTSLHSWQELDNFWNDREEGDWDYYLIRSYRNNQAVSWVEARYATLALKGTDGWFITDFDIHLHTSDQSTYSYGSSHIYDDPDTWLDSQYAEAWDYYTTPIPSNPGRLNF